MVACDHEHRQPAVLEPVHETVEHRHSLGPRILPVINVPGNHQGITLQVLRLLNHFPEQVFLQVQELPRILMVKGLADVQVRYVQKSHRATTM